MLRRRHRKPLKIGYLNFVRCLHIYLYLWCLLHQEICFFRDFRIASEFPVSWYRHFKLVSIHFISSCVMIIRHVTDNVASHIYIPPKSDLWRMSFDWHVYCADDNWSNLVTTYLSVINHPRKHRSASIVLTSTTLLSYLLNRSCSRDMGGVMILGMEGWRPTFRRE